MATLWLTYGARVAAIEDGEDAWDDRTGGNVTCSADTGIYVVGSKSAKMLTGAQINAGTKMASETISSSNLSTYTHVAFWVRCSAAAAAGDLQLMLDDTADCASPIETINLEAIPVANQWYRQVLPLATPASDTAIASIGLKAGVNIATGVSIYIDDVVPCVAKSYSFYGIRGLYQPDEVTMYPGTRTTLLDGSDHELIYAYKRLVTIDLIPVTVPADRIFLMNWARNANKYVVYLADDLRVVLEDPAGFANEWLSGVENFPKWTLRCVEKSARTTDPTSWGYTI